jgi:Protein of unknown function (DUF2384)
MGHALRLAPKATAPAFTPDEVRSGLRAFFDIMDKWGVGTDAAVVLLGGPARSTFFAWKKGQGAEFSLDLATRVSYVLGIFRALELIYQDAANADRWVSQPNLAFGAESALDRMMGGHITDLAAVRDYLDRVRGGW